MDFVDQMEVRASHADGKLLAGRVDDIGVVLFNQPEKRNAMSLEMWEGACQALDDFAADDSVRVVIYAGAGGKAFSAGADISQFESRRSDAAGNANAARIMLAGRASMLGLAKPGIACVQGICLGGGIVTALQADLRVASADAVFGIPAGRMGLAYRMEHMERLVAAVGPARALLMLYSADRFTAAQALSMGLVDIVAERDAVAETLELARKIAANAPLSMQAAKFAVAEAQKAPERRDLAAMQDWITRCNESADHREGRAAFMEKRRAMFIGR